VRLLRAASDDRLKQRDTLHGVGIGVNKIFFIVRNNQPGVSVVNEGNLDLVRKDNVIL
jgi:hypothetical protein